MTLNYYTDYLKRCFSSILGKHVYPGFKHILNPLFQRQQSQHVRVLAGSTQESVRISSCPRFSGLTPKVAAVGLGKSPLCYQIQQTVWNLQMPYKTIIHFLDQTRSGCLQVGKFQGFCCEISSVKFSNSQVKINFERQCGCGCVIFAANVY